MSTTDDTATPPWLAGAWTATDAARRLGYPLPAAEMLMDRITMQGLATRITCGRTTVYVPNAMHVDGTEGER